MPPNDADIRQALNDRRTELIQSSADHEEERAPVELDQQSVGRLSRMDALQVQAMAKESERRRQNEVQRINTALVRLADGEYGYCVTCGEDINPKRLEFDASIPTCIDCARGGRSE
jgi:DnaK suppressor protein